MPSSILYAVVAVIAILYLLRRRSRLKSEE